MLGSGLQKLGIEVQGNETLIVLSKAECGICKHTWDIQALDAEMCDLIHGETLQVLCSIYGLQPQGSQSLRCERTLAVSRIRS